MQHIYAREFSHFDPRKGSEMTILTLAGQFDPLPAAL